MIRDLEKLKRVIEAGGIDFTETDSETSLGNGCIKELLNEIEYQKREINRWRRKHEEQEMRGNKLYLAGIELLKLLHMD